MTGKYIIEKSKDNYKILKINNFEKKIYIGSKYNEKRELEKFIDSAKPMTKNDNYIVLGLGMGNHIKELIKNKCYESKILVVECEQEWIKEFNEDSEIEKFDEEVYVAKTETDIKNFINLYINEQNIEKLKIITYANYNKIYKEQLLYYYKIIKENTRNIKLNRNTRIAFSKIWFESKMKNLKYISESERLSDYKNKYKDKPAIIVSAGPSLEKNIAELKDYNNAVIISGGRTLKSLINIGREPEYTVIVDPSDKSYELVDGYIDKVKSKLVYDLGTPYKALEAHNGGKIIFSAESALDEIMNGKVGTLYGGGSVAHYMTTFALSMGCNPIIFIGQDFAYTGEKGHAKVAESPWESNDIENYKNKTDLLVEDVYGEDVRTSPLLNLYRLQMEEIIAQNTEVTFINATEGGANIKGTQVESLKSILSRYSECVNYEENRELFNLDIHKRLFEKIRKSYLVMKEVSVLYEKGVEILKVYNYSLKYGMKDTYKIEKELKEVENKIIKLNEKIIFIESITYPIIHNVTNSMQLIYKSEDTELEKRIKNIKKSIVIYQEMKNTIIYALPIIENTIKDLKMKEI